MRVIAYAQPQAGSAVASAAARAAAGAKKSAHIPPVWLHQRLVANWSWPPYFTELYDHRAEDFVEDKGETSTPTTSIRNSSAVPQHPNFVERGLPGSAQYSSTLSTVDAATRELLASGGGFDLSEAVNVASQHSGVSESLFYELRELFDEGLR